jgi:acyl-CoA synthetase (AMP-forming)/AMP-acid ligase II
MNCLSNFLQHLQSHPQRMAFVSAVENPLTYREFSQLSGSIQHAFIQRGIKPDDRILVYCRPSARMFAAITAALGIGATIVFLEPWLEEFKDIAEDLSPKLVLTDAVTRWLWRNADVETLNIGTIKTDSKFQMSIRDVSPESDAIIAFSSGTFGVPKGVVRTHSYLTSLIQLLSEGDTAATRAFPDLAVLPGIAMLHLATGRGIVWAGTHWRPRALKKLRHVCNTYRPSTLSTGPRFLKQLLDANISELKCLKKIYIGGASCDVSLVDESIIYWPDADIQHIYGSTEIEPIALCDAREAVKFSRAQGFEQMLYLSRPLPHIEFKIEQDELMVRSQAVCTKQILWEDGTVQFKEKNAPELWHRTGDRVTSINGMLFFSGRTNVPKEVFLKEQALYQELGRTDFFIHRTDYGKDILVAPFKVTKTQLERWSLADTLKKSILWDRRHRSRINRQETVRPKSTITQWRHYVAERAPLGAMALIAGGVCFTAWDKTVSVTSIGTVFVFLMVSLFLMRLYDEMKDCNKDRQAHPARPLARGLISLSDANAVGHTLFATLLALSTVLLFHSPLAGFAGGLVLIWIRLIGKDFYLKSYLKSHLLLSTLIHQLVIFPLYFLPFALSPQTDHRAYWFVSATFFGSLMFEFTRKMGAKAAPDETNYTREYGIVTVASILCICAAGYAVSMSAIHFKAVAAVSALMMISALIPYCLRRSSSKPLEASAILSNLAAFWSSPFARAFASIFGGAH